MPLKLSWAVGILLAVGLTTAAMADDAPLNARNLNAALKKAGSNKQASAKLAEQLRGWLGVDNLKKGVILRTEGLTAVWAIEQSGLASAPEIVTEEGAKLASLKRITDTDLYASSVELPDGAGFRWICRLNGKVDGDYRALELYNYPPETKRLPGVPAGKVIPMPDWKSHVFEGTTREWWIYQPAQYDPVKPACVMVFQDGGGPQNYAPPVLDNLIAKGEIPVMAAIFINPGHFADGRSNRSFEYDTLSDQYTRFLLEEILPEAEKTLQLRHDPESRAIAGVSSGGICAWTVAWQRPDQFSKVLSWVGSFTDIASGESLREGGHNYPALIRKTPKKPIRIFLQDGKNDLDNVHGNWPLANQSMAKALQFAGYDYKFVFGNGFHSDAHGRALLPESLRWLWRDYPK